MRARTTMKSGFALVICATLSGCAVVGGGAVSPVEDRSGSTQRSTSTPAPRADGVEVYATPAYEGAPLEQRAVPLGEYAAPEDVPAQTMQQSPAVVALLDNAGQQRGAGRLDAAAAALERALRIEPRNAVVWNRLAEIRLEQQQPDQAEALAQKSNSLAGGDVVLQSRNWNLIAEARRQRGDVEGARDAQARAGSLAPMR